MNFLKYSKLFEIFNNQQDWEKIKEIIIQIIKETHPQLKNFETIEIFESISVWKKLYNDLIDFCVWKLFNSDGYDEISRLILKHLEKCSNYQNAGIVIVALYDAYNEYLERHPRYMEHPLA
ncbi:MAG: hypothetical protein KatS3mg002_0404 [Candidatus Woesearchaeota archaeon]|nr:MAG: hypothetical protein KatS3mg002_0404 [Candidatus Woesearchaeota archaeon]